MRYGNINGYQWLQHHRWTIDEVGWVKTNFVGELEDRIKEKNQLIDVYLQGCDSCWLLIVADRKNADEKFEFNEEMKGRSFHSLFEKTFFMELPEGVCFELKTHKA